MITPVSPDNVSTSTPEHSGVEFGVSTDGFPVARIGDIILAMLPLKEGGGFLASAWCLRRPLCDLARADFYSHEGRIANEAAFRVRVLERQNTPRNWQFSVVYRRVCRAARPGVLRRLPPSMPRVSCRT